MSPDRAQMRAWLRRQAALVGSTTRTTSPSVVLTLDDGPDPEVTPRVLEVLDRRAVHATFFVLLTRVRRHPELLRETLDRGHEVALHGPDHQALTRFPPREQLRRTRSARAELEDVAGRPVRWFRPPYGRQSPATWTAVRWAGLEPVLWSATTWDWNPAVTDAERLDEAARGARPGAILLAHDGIADQRDGVDDPPAPDIDRAALLALVLDRLAAQGRPVGSLAMALEHGLRVREARFTRGRYPT